MKVKIVNKSQNELPVYATIGSAGFDIRSNQNIILAPNEHKLISTGLYIQLSQGYELQIRPRSGMSLKNKVTVLNSPGTLDSDYTGECMIMLINHSDVNFNISVGDRIAQGVISRYDQAEWVTVDELEQTDRGSGGFGSTGVK